MPAETPSIRAQLAELRQQLSKLESLREVLGDDLTDEKKAELESQVRALVKTGGGAFFAADVDVSHGDLVGRDKWQVILGDSDDSPTQDPLEETVLTAKALLSKHPFRVFLILFFAIATFASGAALSGIIEDLTVVWFRENASRFLIEPNNISRGWLLILLITASIILVISVILAIRNFRHAENLKEQTAVKSRQIRELHGVLDNQKRLLDRFKRDRAFQDQNYDRLTTNLEREYRVLSILDEALLLMVHSILSGHESPEKARKRFFDVFKLTFPRYFAHRESIRNVCILEPNGDYLLMSSYSTIPLPSEVESIAKYYIGDDKSQSHNSGIEGQLFRQINSDNSNLVDIEPIVVRVTNRLEDRASDHENYIGFYGRAGMTPPFASYLVIPIGYQWGLLRIESFVEETFGPAQFVPLKQMIRVLGLAFTVASALGWKQGECVDE